MIDKSFITSFDMIYVKDPTTFQIHLVKPSELIYAQTYFTNESGIEWRYEDMGSTWSPHEMHLLISSYQKLRHELMYKNKLIAILSSDCTDEQKRIMREAIEKGIITDRHGRPMDQVQPDDIISISGSRCLSIPTDTLSAWLEFLMIPFCIASKIIA